MPLLFETVPQVLPSEAMPAAELEDRIARYTERAAQCRPLFEGGEPVVEPDRFTTLTCGACGLVVRRKGNVSGRVRTGARWKCRLLKSNAVQVTYCPDCYARWGWGAVPGTFGKAG
jgi:hypothetical protein